MAGAEQQDPELVMADGQEEEEEVVTLSEVIEKDAELNEAANAVLGDCSESNCSYPLGYIRQPIYACLTCIVSKSDEYAGICLACSYHCHEGHELVELYTKRDFRCDCGNSKFPQENPCKLENDKAIYNDRNKYSQNFKGLYCVCHRPYPDPERSTSEVMIQCIICEDWLHQEHIFQEQDKSSFYAQDFDEFICHGCMKEHPFLMVYKVIPELKEEEEMEEKDVCLFAKRQKLKQADSENIKPTFWNREWREQLCQCSICIAMYEREKVTFLIDLEDSLLAYEEKAREQQRDANIEEAAQKAFQKNLSHEQQVEMAIGYNHMKNSLQQYLTSFATHGKTVRAEDIQHFFQTLKENQKNSTSSSNDAKRQRIGSP